MTARQMTMDKEAEKAAEALLAPSLPGAVVKALGALADGEALHEVCRNVHAFPRETPPDEETGETKVYTVTEVIDGRVFVRTIYRGAGISEGVLIDSRTADRFTADESVSFSGRSISSPFLLTLHGDAGPTEEDIEKKRFVPDAYPNLDALVPKPEQRLLFVIPPKELAAALKTMGALGCKSVEVLAPEYRGGPLGLRGYGDSVSVEACVMPRNPFAYRSTGEKDVEGQSIFDFHETEAQIRARLAKTITVGTAVTELIEAAPEGSGMTLRVLGQTVMIERVMKAAELSERILDLALVTGRNPLDILADLRKQAASLPKPKAKAAAVPASAPPPPDFGEGLDQFAGGTPAQRGVAAPANLCDLHGGPKDENGRGIPKKRGKARKAKPAGNGG